MTLLSRHRIRNSNPGGLRPSTLPIGHGGSPHYRVSQVDGEDFFFVFFKPPKPGNETLNASVKGSGAKIGLPLSTTIFLFNIFNLFHPKVRSHLLQIK